MNNRKLTNDGEPFLVHYVFNPIITFVIFECVNFNKLDYTEEHFSDDRSISRVTTLKGKTRERFLKEKPHYFI